MQVSAARAEHTNHKAGTPANGGKPLVESSAAEPSAAAAVVGAFRVPANHRAGPYPRAPKHKNHRPAPQPPPPPRPSKHHNHQPGGLDEEGSAHSPRYRKRPLGPLEQVS